MIINLSTYIFEKLHLNKNIDDQKPPKINEADFCELLSECGKIQLYPIFKKQTKVDWPWTKKGYTIDSIYYDEGNLIGIYTGTYSKIESEEVLDFEDFTDEQIRLIYDYIIEKRNTLKND